ncbi:BLUF domain-containing protein [Sphingobium chungbukense]|uniref:Blue light sensor protein n=1 Tax=Sphingobium chungbukense TaxID=56193 RepID=A0A0M3AP77_9SPHN|nr:BLUF domain-containing protein [Sphingobium chungbukense]KKW91992.1 blue light sensor protein [Sphingobium chungbukense]
MLHRWFYISTSRLDARKTNEGIQEIVEVSLPRNRSLRVTGALLFTGQKFTQYLEGSPAAIAELKQSISRDARHEAIHTIAYGPFDHRRFLGWSLAYAGPSRFVAAKVEKALSAVLDQGDEEIEALAEMLAGFAIEGHS